MDHETHISTQQTPPQKDRRIPRPYENSRRPQGDQQTPQSRPEKASSLSFPKTLRLRKRGEFQSVAKKGKRLVGRYLCIDCHPAPKARLGISASARYGCSPERNRFKRLVREAFRQAYATLPHLDLNIIPRQSAKGASCSNILDELIHLLK